LLISLSVGTDPSTDSAWPVYVSSEPNLPDNLITVYDSAGILQGRIHRTGQVVEQYGTQIQIRGTDYTTLWPKVNSIKVALEESVSKNIVDIVSNEYIVYAMNRQSGPIFLGAEPGTNRLLFTINYCAAINQLL
jgi:hypothetical protein